MMHRKVPFTVIGGFLGAGKTSLVNQLLNQTEKSYAVLVNDFGALNIDRRLIQKHQGTTIDLANGCICCSLAAGFSLGLGEVLDRINEFEHVVIEASGVANPQRIQDIAKIQPQLIPRANIVVVDVAQLMSHVKDPLISSMICHQLNAADYLLLNKRSQISEEGLHVVRHFIQQFSQAPSQVTDWAEADTPFLLAQQPISDKKIIPWMGELSEHGLQSQLIRKRLSISHNDFLRWSETLGAEIVRAKGFVRFYDHTGDWLWQKTGAQQSLSRADAQCLDESHDIEILLIGKESTVLESYLL